MWIAIWGILISWQIFIFQFYGGLRKSIITLASHDENQVKCTHKCRRHFSLTLSVVPSQRIPTLQVDSTYTMYIYSAYTYILHTVFMYKIIYARLYRRRNRNDAWIVKYVHRFVCSQLIQFLNCTMYSKRIKYSKH